MKAKHIRVQIREKINEWLTSIEDQTLREYLSDQIIVTGGCIVSMLMDDKVHDYDVYFRTRDAAYAIAKYYVDKFTKNPPPRFKTGKPVNISVRMEDDRVKIYIKSVGIAGEEGDESGYEYFEAVPDTDNAIEYVAKVAGVLEDEKRGDLKPYRPIFLSSNAITLSDKIQIITRFFGEPDDIHLNYDFVHCTNYWTSWGEQELVLKPAALEAILAKELRYIGSKYPLCSVIRIRKFLNRGWYITAGSILKILWQVHELDLANPAVLEDQLTGVDAAYFYQVIELLRKKQTADGRIDRAYLFEVIDKIF